MLFTGVEVQKWDLWGFSRSVHSSQHVTYPQHQKDLASDPRSSCVIRILSFLADEDDCCLGSGLAQRNHWELHSIDELEKAAQIAQRIGPKSCFRIEISGAKLEARIEGSGRGLFPIARGSRLKMARRLPPE
jgi:hypothetical protein